MVAAAKTGAQDPFELTPVTEPGQRLVALAEFIPDHLVFLTHVAPEVLERRRVQTQQLQERDGGPLGIQGVAELVVAVSDRTDATDRWQRLLAPTPVTVPGSVRLGGGADIRLEPGGRDAIVRAVFRVKDVDRTASMLAQHGLLGDRTDEQVMLRPDRVQTLQLAFTAAA